MIRLAESPKEEKKKPKPEELAKVIKLSVIKKSYTPEGESEEEKEGG